MNAPFSLIETYQSIKARILSEYDDLDEETLADTIDGEMEVSPEDLIVRWLLEAEEAKADAEAIASLIAKYQTRKERRMHLAQARREMAQSMMAACEIKSIKRPEMTVSRGQAAPKVIVTDESMLPPHLMTVKTYPDKAAIKDALQYGRVDGAHLSNGGETIRVRIA